MNRAKIWFLATSLATCSFCYPLYIGNAYLPELPEEGLFIPQNCSIGIKTSYLGSLVLDRALKPYKSHAGNIKNFQLHANEGFLTLSFMDRVELFSGFGAGVFQINEMLNKDVFIEMLSKQSFIWDAGGRVLLIFWEDTSLSAFAGYQSSHPPLKQIVRNAQIEPSVNQKLSYSEWEIALTLGQKIGFFSPYIGGSYSKTLLKYKSVLAEAVSKKYENAHSFCLIVGASLTAEKVFGIDIEAKAFGEESFSLNANFRF